MTGTFDDLMADRQSRKGFKTFRIFTAELFSVFRLGLSERYHGRNRRSHVNTGQRQHQPRERTPMHVTSNFRFALRGLARTPGYTFAFVLTLGLGIGANTAIFSVLNGVLLRPLPYPDADRIMYVQQVAQGGGTNNTALSFPEVNDYRTRTGVFEEVVEFGDWTFNVLGRGEPHLTNAGLVTANFFRVLGLRPHIGRTLVEGDDARDAPPVVVLTYEYWVNVFGADSGVIGQTLDLTAKRATIVGVLEPGSHYASTRAQPLRSVLAGRQSRTQDLYANYPTNDHYMGAAMQDERAHRMTDVFARLAPDVTVEAAQAEVATLANTLYIEYPEAYPETRAYEMVVTPWLSVITEQARPMLLILFGTAVFVLIIACANVANLTLTRLIRREREFAIRAALGAGRARLRGQLLAENLLLSFAGAALGLVIAVTGLDLLVAYASRFTSRINEIGVDVLVLAFTLFIAVGAAMLFAWAPKLPISSDLGSSLSAAGGGRSTGAVSRRRAQRLLVVSQLAISFMLLVGAGLLLRSLANLNDVDPGFEVDNVLTMDVPTYSQRTQAEEQQFATSLMDRVSQHSQIHGAAMANGAPLNQPFVTQTHFQVVGAPEDPNPPRPLTMREIVTPDYFQTIGTPMVAGRAFNSSDNTETGRVAIINKSMADFYFPQQDPIGRQVKRQLTTDRWTAEFTIIGVVGDTKAAGLDRDAVHAFYEASTQTFSPATLLVRTEGDPRSLAGHVIEEVRGLDADRPIVNVQTLADLRSDNMAPQRLNAMLFGIFSLLALVIATVGIAGVLGFSVSQRTNEFGIRMTLGANRDRVMWMVLREGVLLAASALAIGGVGALLLSKFLSGLLFEVQPTDPVTFVGVAVLLAAVAVAASLAPARNATSVDPIVALKSE